MAFSRDVPESLKHCNSVLSPASGASGTEGSVQLKAALKPQARVEYS